MNENERREQAGALACFLDGSDLDHVIGLLHDRPELIETCSILMSDERMRVRLGTTAALEDLCGEDSTVAAIALPILIPLLQNENPLVRGDAANLIAILGGRDCEPRLQPLLYDSDPGVVAVIQDILDDWAESTS